MGGKQTSRRARPLLCPPSLPSLALRSPRRSHAIRLLSACHTTDDGLSPTAFPSVFSSWPPDPEPFSYSLCVCVWICARWTWPSFSTNNFIGNGLTWHFPWLDSRPFFFQFDVIIIFPIEFFLVTSGKTCEIVNWISHVQRTSNFEKKQDKQK